MAIVRRLLGGVLIIGALAQPPAVSLAAPAESFDAPLRRQVVDFGPSPYYSGGKVRSKLSCYFFRTFLVKEYDEGQKGAEWLAIAPSGPGTASVCSKSHAAGERVIEAPEWSGYFKGAKGKLVFIDAADGVDGGMPFAIYDSTTGAKVFEDSYYDARMWSRRAGSSPFNRMRVSIRPDGQVALRYLRVIATDCDLNREGPQCWEQVRKKLELKRTELPVCSGYKHLPTRWVSAVAYPVVVSVFPRAVMNAVDGPIKCWPVD